MQNMLQQMTITKSRLSEVMLPYLHWTLVAFSLLKKPITLKQNVTVLKCAISFKRKIRMILLNILESEDSYEGLE